jgi:hypothetical protein
MREMHTLCERVIPRSEPLHGTWKSDQVLLGVVARVAAKLFVVNIQVRHRATRLTPPAVAVQNLLPQSFVRFWI